MLIPKFVTTLRDYSREQFARDLTAGVIVGIVALVRRRVVPEDVGDAMRPRCS